MKYDAAHGETHLHRFYKQLDDRGKALSGREISQETFEECRKDIKKNWRKYRKWYAEKWLGGQPSR